MTSPGPVATGNRFGYILKACRPPTLLLGFTPVLVGSSYGIFQQQQSDMIIGWQNWLSLAGCLLLVFCLQSAANLINDLKDAESGVDSAETRLGPQRYVSSGLLAPGLVRMSYRLLLLLGLVTGVGLALIGGWIAVGLAAICVVFAYAYTAGPWPLSHYGLGELVAFIFFGPVAVGGCYFLQTGHWTSAALSLGAGPGFLAAAVMAINNFRDRENDYLSGKKTIATRLPVQAAQRLPWIFILAAIIIIGLLSALALDYTRAILVALSLVILAHIQIKPWLKNSAPQLNQALKQTTKFSFLYSVVFVGSLFV